MYPTVEFSLLYLLLMSPFVTSAAGARLDLRHSPSWDLEVKQSDLVPEQEQTLGTLAAGKRDLVTETQVSADQQLILMKIGINQRAMDWRKAQTSVKVPRLVNLQHDGCRAHCLFTYYRSVACGCKNVYRKTSVEHTGTGTDQLVVMRM